MKRLLLGAGGICLSLGLSACGGGSRGLSGDIPVFNTVLVTLSGPAGMDVDMVNHIPIKAAVNANWPQCNLSVPVDDACIGHNIPTDNIQLNFSVDVIRNAQGQPVTQNPSSVLLRGYTVRFSGCVSGVYQFSSGVVLPPSSAGTNVPIPLITQDMKRNLLVQVPYVYVHKEDRPGPPGDGCQTTFQIFSYRGICTSVADIEFDLVELNSGITRKVRHSVTVRMSDFNSEGDQCIPF